MLYGSGERLQKQVAIALMLGADLRNLVKPALAWRECTFANVSCITADAVEEYELKAAAWLWSICIVDLPKVNHQRLNHVAHHLLGDNIHPAHVFLKVEAFRIEATVSVISDLDMMILDGERMAQYLHRFYADPSLVRQMEQSGHVAVMHRWHSSVIFQDTPMTSRTPYRATANTET